MPRQKGSLRKVLSGPIAFALFAIAVLCLTIYTIHLVYEIQHRDLQIAP